MLEPDAEAVRAVLNTITDPCSIAARTPMGLDDMGLIGEITVAAGAGGAHVALAVGVTHPFCLMAAVFMNEAQKRVGAMPGVASVDVRFDADNLWAPERMKPEQRARMMAARSPAEPAPPAPA
jgi:metal-sulfur cluster biosynthetic enzyme